jgi:hypothetical protein
MAQLITIAADGSMTALQVKRGKGLDLRQFGHADIVRSSLIEWDAEVQGWKVRLLHCTVDHGLLTPDLCHKAGVDVPDTAQRYGEGGECALYFDEYEDAVTAEVDVIQGLRRIYGRDAA